LELWDQIGESTTKKMDEQLIDTLQSYIEDQMKSDAVTGLSIALVDGQRIMLQQGFGYADKANKVKASSTTVYRAGSITKLFTALAAMQLHEQGKWDIHQPLRTYLPGFNIQSRFGGIDAITPANIMSHHSGLPTDYFSGMWREQAESYTSLVSKLSDQYVAYPPNLLSVYSNIGYGLLGHAMANVSTLDYPRLIDESILSPLGMSSSSITKSLTGKNATLGYHKGKPMSELELRELSAGGLSTTVSDMAKFIKLIHRRGSGDGALSTNTQASGSSIINAGTLDEMIAVKNADNPLDFDLRVAYGWFYFDNILPEGVNVIGHDGQTVTNYSQLLIAPKAKVGVIVLANDTGKSGTAVKKIAEEALKRLYRQKEGNATDVVAGQKQEKAHVSPVVGAQMNFPGNYMTVVGGFTKIEAHGKDFQFYADAYNTNFELLRNKSGQFHLRKRLFGLIPISLSELQDIEFRTEMVAGYHILVGREDGKDFLAGQKILETKNIPRAWLNRVGTYQLLHQLEPERLHVEKLELQLNDEFLIAKQTFRNGEVESFVLNVIDNNNAVVAGLGRGLGIHVKAVTEGGLETLQTLGLKYKCIQ
jgi:CubicO group peptidase (beta-lactamase class C family)